MFKNEPETVCHRSMKFFKCLFLFCFTMQVLFYVVASDLFCKILCEKQVVKLFFWINLLLYINEIMSLGNKDEIHNNVRHRLSDNSAFARQTV